MEMEAPSEFPSVTLSDLATSSSAAPAAAVFAVDSSDKTRLRFVQKGSVASFVELDLETTQVFRVGPVDLLCVSGESEDNATDEVIKVGLVDMIKFGSFKHFRVNESLILDKTEVLGNKDKRRSFSRGFKVGFKTKDESKGFSIAFEKWKNRRSLEDGGTLENGLMVPSKSKFDSKIEATSAKMYFHYYGQLLHQQNMLQDFVRTGTYYAAVIENKLDFEGRVVVDVGAGSGILSLFAAQAGAKHVYAVEASEMAEYAQKLISGNPSLGQRITVIKGKVEEVELPEKADILISEPMGTLLVNERMLESYIIARDRFLTPNGKMFPTLGRIHMAPFSDEYLYVEVANKALFWHQQNFFGVDLSPLHGSAFQGYFSQPVVDAFDPRLLVSPPIFHTLDFTRMKEEDLYEVDIPLNFIASVGTRVHGLACWFDVLFNGSTAPRWLTTAPGSPTTHWYQLRCVLQQPLYVMAGQQITGRLHLVAHSAQSYTIYLTLSTKTWGPGAEQGGALQTSTGKLELKEPYYRLSQPQAYASSDQQPQPQQPQVVEAQDIPQLQDEIDPSALLEQL